MEKIINCYDEIRTEFVNSIPYSNITAYSGIIAKKLNEIMNEILFIGKFPSPYQGLEVAEEFKKKQINYTVLYLLIHHDFYLMNPSPLSTQQTFLDFVKQTIKNSADFSKVIEAAYYYMMLNPIEKMKKMENITPEQHDFLSKFCNNGIHTEPNFHECDRKQYSKGNLTAEVFQNFFLQRTHILPNCGQNYFALQMYWNRDMMQKILRCIKVLTKDDLVNAYQILTTMDEVASNYVYWNNQLKCSKEDIMFKDEYSLLYGYLMTTIGLNPQEKISMENYLENNGNCKKK